MPVSTRLSWLFVLSPGFKKESYASKDIEHLEKPTYGPLNVVGYKSGQGGYQWGCVGCEWGYAGYKHLISRLQAGL